MPGRRHLRGRRLLPANLYGPGYVCKSLTGASSGGDGGNAVCLPTCGDGAPPCPLGTTCDAALGVCRAEAEDCACKDGAAGVCARADGDGNACTGTRSCGANQRWVCDAVSPTPELCTPTDIDEDCDGDTDEDCPF